MERSASSTDHPSDARDSPESDDRFAKRAEPYRRHDRTVRGRIRHTLIAEQIAYQLPPTPALIIDIGGGSGQQAIPLARKGYDVVLLDPSPAMLLQANEQLSNEPVDVQQRVFLLNCHGEQATSFLGSGRFDVVLCHGVLMYLDQPRTLIRELTRLARPGGLISVLFKNRRALAMRAALEGRYRDALDALDSDRDRGGMGITRADNLHTIVGLLARHQVDIEVWFGIRVVTDQLGDLKPDERFDAILALERALSGRDPYRQVARLIHLIGRRL